MSLRMIAVRCACLLLAGACGAATHAQTIRYVDDDATGNQTGLSWTDAFVDLQDALAVATVGMEIRVAQGEYPPTTDALDREATFQLISGVTISGGWAGVDAAHPDDRDPALYVTVLTGDIGSCSHCTDNVYHVLTATGADATAVVDGCTISGGQADAGYPHDRGGGLYAEPGGPTLRDCVLTDNYAMSGGALYVGYGQRVTVEACTFRFNTAGSIGGALFTLGSGADTTDCLFDGNTSEVSGGAVADSYTTSTYANCTFLDNLAQYQGGAIYTLNADVELTSCTLRDNYVLGNISTSRGGGGAYHDGGAPQWTQCTLASNISNRNGGALYCTESYPVLRNCLLAENLASYDGGGVYDLNGGVQLVSCGLVGNFALGRGGAIFSDTAALELTACTLASNRSLTTQAGGVAIIAGSPTLLGTVLWDNRNQLGSDESAQLQAQYAAVVIDYCCVQAWTGGWGGLGNFGSAPAFANRAGADGVLGTEDDELQLGADSPCIDAGDPDQLPDPVWPDLYGEPRLVCDVIDVGAAEAPRRVGDANCDRVVDLVDYLDFDTCIAGPAAGQRDPDCASLDHDSDGDVDLRDYALYQQARDHAAD